MKRGIITIVICALCFWTLPAKASLVTIQIAAKVDFVGDPYGYFEGKIKIGDTITGSYAYDSSTPDQDWLWGSASPTVGRYHYFNPPCGITLTAGGFVFQTDPTNVNFLVGVGNDGPSGNDIYWLNSYNNLALSNGTSVDSIYWQLEDPTGTVFSDDALPITAPILDDWQLNSLGIHGPLRGNSFGIVAHVTSAEVVPEPTTLFLLLFGGLRICRRKNLVKYN